jgi:hypothetical protein
MEADARALPLLFFDLVVLKIAQIVERADNVLEIKKIESKTCVYCLWAKPYLYKDLGRL